jgi:hypothetical protein
VDLKDVLGHTIVTWSLSYRVVLATSRIFLRQSLILEGETGCRKISILEFIRVALNLPWNSEGHPLTHVLAESLDFHGGIGRDRFMEYIEEIKTSTRPTIAFCDEINTSRDCSFIEHHMLNEMPGLKPKIGFLGAVNLLTPLTMDEKYQVGMK